MVSMNRRDVFLAGLAVIAVLLRGARVSAGPRAPAATTAGTRVVVTKEMLGAGAVQSGVALPPIPPVTGSRRSPVPSSSGSMGSPTGRGTRRAT